MEPLDEPARPTARVDPADLELPPTTTMTIDIARLLTARARTLTTLELDGLENAVPFGDDQRFGPLLGLISRSVQGALGLVELPHLRVLVLLSQRGTMSVGELSALTGLRARGVFALLDSMQASGWVSSDSQARAMGESIAITQRGRSVIESMTEQRQREIDEILERVSEQDRLELTRAFNAFAAAAGEAPARKPPRGITR